jgi:hypothetical protein
MSSSRLNADLSETSYQAWLGLANRNGSSLTALLEAFGAHLDDPEVRAVLQPIVTDAVRITIERRRRR